MLSRKHGAHLCYTPMFHAKIFSENEAYREKEFTTCPEDRPLIVQFCGNDPDTVLAAAKHVEDRCDAVDLNLGCPQGIAKKGFYGSYLQDEWDLIASIVKNLHENLKVPVTCKIRVFPDVEKTIRYAKMLEANGCQMLTVHGRTREQRQQNTGLADWEQIRMVREAVSIPVVSNGNILYHEDVETCLEVTGCVGVMTAEGNLYNPFIFEPGFPLAAGVAREFIEMVEKHGALAGHVRGHFFKFLRPAMNVHTEFRSRLGNAHGMEEIMTEIKSLLELIDTDYKKAVEEGREMQGVAGNESVPHWFCQPYIRPLPTADYKKATGTKRSLPREESELVSVEPSLKEAKVEA